MPRLNWKAAFVAISLAITPAAYAMPVGCGTPNTASGLSEITTSPNSLSFTVFQGSSASQSLAISEVGLSTDNWSASPTVGFLSLSPGAAAMPPSGSSGTQVTANAGSLQPGTYSGSVVITPSRTCTGSTTPGVTKTVPVSMTVVGRPTISLSTTTLNFTAGAGGSNPASQTVTLSNTGTGTMEWAITISGGNWLRVSPGAGTGNATLTISAVISGLAAGTYNSALRVDVAGATNSPQTVNVTLVLSSGNPVLAVSSPSLAFSANTGVNPAAQTFQVQNTGTGTFGWTAAAATQSGGNWLSINPATGTAPSTVNVTVNSASLAAAIYSGIITVTALASSNAANSPQTIQVTLAVGVPLVPDNGIVNGASFSTDAIVSPASIASIFGLRLASSTVIASQLPLPTILAGTQVLVNERAAPLFFVSSGQINFQVPADAAGSTVPVVVVSGGVRGNTANMRIGPHVPGIFSAVPGGTGQGAVLNQDFSLNSAQNPAAARSVIQIFLTGLGATNPALATGQIGAVTPPFNLTVVTPVVLISGAQAEVLFSAMAPGFVGLYQVNARVPPATAPGGSVQMQVQSGGRISNTVTIGVR